MFNRPHANGGKISTAAYQYSSDNGTTWQGPVSVSATSDPVIIVVPNLTQGKTYKFKVAVANEVGWSPWAEVGAVTLARGKKPPKPTGSASATEKNVTLSWTLGDVAAGSIVKIFMQQGADNAPKTLIKTENVTASNFTTSVDVGAVGKYCFYAQVVDDNGCESDLSNPVCITIALPPNPPGAATITGASDCVSNSAVVKFAQPNANGGKISTAAYQYSSDNGITWTGANSVSVNSDPIQFTVSNLAPSKTYKFRAAVSNEFGWSAYAEVGSITFGAAKKPAAPTNGKGSSKNLAVTLSWTVAASAAGATVKIFSQQGAATAPKNLITTVNAAGTNVTTSVTVGATGAYSFYAQVIVGGCESDLSAPVNLTITNFPQVVPGTPTKPLVTSGTACESANTGSVTVSSSVTNAGPPITQYEYQTRRLTSLSNNNGGITAGYSTPSAIQSTPVNDPASAAGGPFEFKPNLDDGQYQVRVRAVNSVGAGLWSAWGAGTVGSAAYGTSPSEAKPGPFTLSASVSATAAGNVNYVFTWTTPSVKNINRGPALRYRVYLLRNEQHTEIASTSLKTYTYSAGSDISGGRFYVLAFSASCSSKSNEIDASTLYWKCSNPANFTCTPTLNPSEAYIKRSDCIANCDNRTCGPSKHTDGDCVFVFSDTIKTGKEDFVDNSTQGYNGRVRRRCVAGAPQYTMVTFCAPIGGQPGDCAAIELRSDTEECVYRFPLMKNGKTKTVENVRANYTGTKTRYCKNGKSTYKSFKACRPINDTRKQCKPSIVEFGDCTFRFDGTINLNSSDTVETNTPGFSGAVRRNCENNGASYEILEPCSPLLVPGKSCTPINVTAQNGCRYSFPAAADGSLDFLSTTTPGRAGKYSRWCNDGENSIEEVEPCIANPDTAVCPPELVGANDCVYDFIMPLNPGQSDVVDTSTPGYTGRLRRTCFIGGQPGYSTVTVCAMNPGKNCPPKELVYRTVSPACGPPGANPIVPCDCRYVSPEMADKQVLRIDNLTPGFTGEATARCNNGTVTITRDRCDMAPGYFCFPPPEGSKTYGACRYTINTTMINANIELINSDTLTSFFLPATSKGVLQRTCVNGVNEFKEIEACHPITNFCASPVDVNFFEGTDCSYRFTARLNSLGSFNTQTVNTNTPGYIGRLKRTCTRGGGSRYEQVEPCRARTAPPPPPPPVPPEPPVPPPPPTENKCTGICNWRWRDIGFGPDWQLENNLCDGVRCSCNSPRDEGFTTGVPEQLRSTNCFSI